MSSMATIYVSKTLKSSLYGISIMDLQIYPDIQSPSHFMADDFNDTL